MTACAREPHPANAEAALLQSGMSTRTPSSARSGYLPLPLEQVLVKALDGLPVFLHAALQAATSSRFTLYCSPERAFTEHHRQRLHDAGVRFLYIPMEQHGRFQRQMEDELAAMAADPAVAVSTKSALVYQTSLELINEILTEQGVGKNLPRLEKVARAVSTLVVSEAEAFSHLFAAAQHDFYTATHMVNVGTFMTSLAFAMGITDSQQLGDICTAGMLHDVGKLFVPEQILNQPRELQAAEWKLLQEHPQRGVAYLRKEGIVSEVVLRVTHEHHERIDGTGYPRRIRKADMHPISLLCAVVDSFDAMTACRPFRNRVKTITEAIKILQVESVTKYDAAAVTAWLGLLQNASKSGLIAEPLEFAEQDPTRIGRRIHERFDIECPMRVHELLRSAKGWEENRAITAKGHNISVTGLGFLSPKPLRASTYMRAYLMGAGTLDKRIVEGQVVRCRAYGDGWFEVGMKICIPGEQEEASARVQEQHSHESTAVTRP